MLNTLYCIMKIKAYKFLYWMAKVLIVTFKEVVDNPRVSQSVLQWHWILQSKRTQFLDRSWPQNICTSLNLIVILSRAYIKYDALIVSRRCNVIVRWSHDYLSPKRLQVLLETIYKYGICFKYHKQIHWFTLGCIWSTDQTTSVCIQLKSSVLNKNAVSGLFIKSRYVCYLVELFQVLSRLSLSS